MASDSLKTKRLRLLKVAVQPTFVLEDNDTLTEVKHGVIEIPAAEWPTYSSERFPREVAEAEKGLNE
jgi:hypothetical protein